MNAPVRDSLERCAALSLDVFDTALLRRVDEPEAVFRLVAARYAHEHAGLTAFDFAAERARAERRARELAHARVGHHEVTLTEIYAALHVPFDWDRERLRAMELELEASLLVRNPYIFELYARALERGIPVVFLSDMYLSSEFIGAALDRAGYRTRALLVVSSESDGASKGTGELFERAAKDLGVRPDEILHIGDNERSDLQMALRSGYTAWHYLRAGELASGHGAVHPGRSLGAALARGLANNELWAHRDLRPTAAFADGYRGLGLLWHEHDGDELAVRRTLMHWPGARSWLERLDGAEGDDLRRGASAMREALREVHAALPWLKLSAVDAVLAFGETGEAPAAVAADDEDALVRLSRLNAEYLAGWARRELADPAPGDKRAGPVAELASELTAFRRRFAPADSLRTRALDWSLHRIRDLTHAAAPLFDLRDALLDQVRRAKYRR